MKRTHPLKYEIDQEPLVLSKPLLDMFYEHKNSAELLNLYLFYYKTAKWQKTNQPKATTNYVARGLQWSEERVRKYKKILIQLGLVEDIVVRNDNNLITGHYISIYPTNVPTQVFPHSGSFHTQEIEGGSALIKNNKMLIAEEKKSTSPNGPITASLFNKFWSLYPKKVDKGKAMTAWLTICNRASKQKPTWREIRRALMFQKESERWKDKLYIPHPTTWLNQSRWLDDPSEMKSYDNNKPKRIAEYGEWWYLDEDGKYYNDEGTLLM